MEWTTKTSCYYFVRLFGYFQMHVFRCKKLDDIKAVIKRFLPQVLNIG